MEVKMSEWADIENFVGENVPMFLKLILEKTGFDSLLSVKHISSESIAELEQYVDNQRNEIILEILSHLEKCGHYDMSYEIYKEQTVFKFLPGHRTILLSLPDNIKSMQSNNLARPVSGLTHGNGSDESLSVSEHPGQYSLILTELIKTARRNANKTKYAYQYNDIVKYFSTYVFLLCGRTCYETLNKNLPIPSTKTICKKYSFVG